MRPIDNKTTVFGTKEQLAEYIGQNHAEAVNDIWDALKAGTITDREVREKYKPIERRGHFYDH